MMELPYSFGKYYLTEKLATGGMAEIFLAKLIGPSGFEKQLVIKLILPQWSSEPGFVDLFVNEAKTLVQLSHGNIVPIYELGVVGSTYFIAMEFVDGITVADVLDLGIAVEPQLVAYIGARVLEGLEYAHHKAGGVLHRDISPRNIMISRDGEVKLLDFGIAVANTASSPKHELAGSWGYMAPEQASSGELSEQSDVFSLAVVLWEMVNIRPLFKAETQAQTLDNLLRANPVTAPAMWPREFASTLERALTFDPKERWQSAGAMANELNRFVYSANPPISAREVATLAAKCQSRVARASRQSERSQLDAASQTQPDAPRPPTVATQVKPRSFSSATGAFSSATGDGTVPIQRQQTFATAVSLERLLATGRTSDKAIETAATSLQPTPDHVGDTVIPAQAEQVLAPPPQHQPTFIRVVAIIGALAIIAAGLWWVLARGNSGSSEVGSPPVADSQPSDSERSAIDGVQTSTIDARSMDAAITLDAPTPAPDDARIVAKVRPDARVDANRATKIDARTTQAKIVLRVGASPWGEITIDGKPAGRTPHQSEISPGPHTIVVSFPVSNPPQAQTFRINADPADPPSVFATFNP